MVIFNSYVKLPEGRFLEAHGVSGSHPYGPMAFQDLSDLLANPEAAGATNFPVDLGLGWKKRGCLYESPFHMIQDYGYPLAI